MTFSYLCFLISQIVFIPTFLMATKLIFEPNMKIRNYIVCVLISPIFVYFYTSILYVIIQYIFPQLENYELYRFAASYADIPALFISFLFAAGYARHGNAAERRMRFFVYTCFYMAGMVFNIVYRAPLNAFIFSVAAPTLSSYLLFKFLVIPLAGIGSSREMFHKSMLFFPISSELMLVLRSFLNIASIQDPNLDKYDSSLVIYITVFGYLILSCIFISTKMITRDISHIKEINDKRDNLVAANSKINRLTIEMLMALVATIEAKDKYTNGHSSRVADYSEVIARRLGYSDDDALAIHQVALLHDIGKIAMPDSIIKKPGRLTNDEYIQVKQHPIKGAEILKKIEEIPDLYIGALYHHERWDGKGYPYGLVGDSIPEIACIISVADAYDAMTTDRSYRSALNTEEVIHEIECGIGKQFCPEPAYAMLDIIKESV